jgi:hypothetical protein
MDRFGLKPGPVIGRILHDLLEMVLDNPEMNEEEILIQKAEEIYQSLKDEAEGKFSS